jgi:hypothetical protein
MSRRGYDGAMLGQRKISLHSHPGMHRVGLIKAVEFAMDSSLEGTGLELSVPFAPALLSRLCGGLASCRSSTVAVGLGFGVGLRAARDPFAMDILLDDLVAVLGHLLVDRHFAVIPVGAGSNRRGGGRA